MKKNFTRFTLSAAFLFLLQFTSVFAQYTEGVFVLNEGGAGGGNATVSFINNNANTNDIYGIVNPSLSGLGDTAQSMSFNGDYAYVVLNISNTVKVVNRTTFAYVATISTGLNNPRYMAFANGKGFVTNWGDGGSASDDYVAVIDLTTNTVESTIPLAEGVERILYTNNKLYIAHQGGYGAGNTISVVNPVTQTLEQTITVGDVPNSMLVNNNFLYVLCGGKPYWSSEETDGQLVKIDLTTNTVLSTLNFPDMHPNNLEINASATSIFYTVDENVYTNAIDASTLPTTSLFSLTAQGVYGIYGMDLIEDKLYIADAGNYSSPGSVYVVSTSGSLLNTYMVGVIPNSFYKAENTLSTFQPESKLAVHLYPNPASNVFYLNTDVACNLKMYDTAGRVVKQMAYATAGVNVSDLKAGIYFVEITTESARTVQRLIVK
ncbi:T9SS type A sorting domain-containing protein [Flavobacterium tegetincola]|uniref:T9SS type A sorting domain-containing protein n=1 Tax=Flavobacterium tegetincola TaxID=150172 RepID=UPI0004282970|nr:DUF5074 domain-containing protein [Flavobacterium tegetincola]